MLPNNLTEKDLKNGCRSDGRSWRTLLAERYYKTFGEDVCETCHGLTPYYQKILRTQNMEDVKKTCLLKRGTNINEPWGGEWYGNLNLTDEVAIAYLNRTGNTEYFEKLPDGYGKTEAPAETEAPADKKKGKKSKK